MYICANFVPYQSVPCTGSYFVSFCSLCTDITILHDVSVAVVTVVNWRELGLALGLSPYTLECIAAQYPGDPSRCLTETLAAWLQKEDEITSWRALVGALRKPTVGKEGLADEIAKAHGM